MKRLFWLVMMLAMGAVLPSLAHEPRPTGPSPWVYTPSTAQLTSDGGLFLTPAGDASLSRIQTRADGLPPEVARRRVVQTDPVYLETRILPRIAAGDGNQPKRVEMSADAVRLNLFPDVVVDAARTKYQHTLSGDFIWEGRPASGAEGTVNLVIAKGRITGAVTVGGITYSIYPDKQGNTVIEQLDPRGFPKVGPHPVPEIPKTDKRGDLPFWRAPADGPSVVGDPNSQTIVTLLAAYTEAAAAESADIVSEINLAVSMANTAYANSGVNITLQLTGTIAATYTESSKDASTVITDARLGMAGSGDLSELQAARIAYGADLVALIVRNYSTFQACGIGYMPLNPTTAYAPYGVSATMRGTCLAGQTLSHETGHNMGLAHDRYAVRKYNEGPWYGTLPQDYDYFGYVSTTAREMDVMSYYDLCNDNGVNCTRATRFSNPSRTFSNGSASGIALGSTDPADNARVLNINKDVVSQWRPATASGLVLTVTKSGTGSGTVTSSPSGISCGSTCSASFASGQVVTLTAAADSGSTFAGWSSSCSGTASTASITMTASAACIATFTGSTSGTPANDAFASATSLSGSSGSTTGSNVNATKETGESSHAGNSGGKSVWWTWTPSSGGSTTITTIGSSFDTLLAVYTGSSVSAVSAIASNDDTSSSLQSSVTFTATAGTTYRIAVDGYGSASGSIVLTWNQTGTTSGPANDAFSSAIALTSPSGTTSGTNVSASKESGEPSHAGNSGGTSVWWKITPTASGQVTVSTAGSSFDTLLAVYTGSAVGSLTSVASNDDTGATLQSAVSFNGTAGTTYYVAVDGYSGSTGSIVLSYTGGPSSTFTVQTGWWWSSSLPGTGFGIEQSGSNLFIGAYLYDTDGTAVWYTSIGTISGNVFSGNLVEYQSGQTLSGTYRAPEVRRTIGTVSITFSSSTAGTLTWPGGTIAIERFDIVSGGVVAGSASGDPEKGWWWSSSESGRGYFIETQGSSRAIFMAAYMYDTDNTAVWYAAGGGVLASSLLVGNSFTGTLSEYGNGQTLGGAWQAPTITSIKGSITIDFTSSTQAVLTLPSGAQVSLTRFTF
ncbi:MAG: hypothetical protein JNL04_11645 [Rhodospirillaceae bacterium]|nr:hypothetical protein [Rhodospirillaceae bacterium]